MLAIILAIENDDDRHLAEKLYNEYSQTMFRIAVAILKDEYRAEDAVADAFERIIKNMEYFSDPMCNKTRGLIVIFIRNVCFNILKRDKIISFVEYHDETTESHKNLEDFVISKESYQELLRLLPALDEQYAEVLRLKYFCEFSNTEIAKMLNISYENVNVRLHRAKNKLKALLLGA